MITYDDSRKLFHLKNSYLSLVLALKEDEAGREEPLMAWMGAPLDDPASALARIGCMREISSFDSLRQILPYACPTAGRGDYRVPMAEARDPSGQSCTELFYRSFEIVPGKPVLPGMPATYTESDDEAETLVITLRDDVTGLEADLRYTIFASQAGIESAVIQDGEKTRPAVSPTIIPDRERTGSADSLFGGAIACSVNYRNTGTAPLRLLRAGSFCLSLPGRWDMIHFQGSWANERNPQRIPPAAMCRSVSSCRGASGSEHNPFVILAKPDTTEHAGECYGVSLVWSGDHEITVEENAYETTRLVAGLNPRTFEWHLAPGETFQTPEAVCVRSGKGLNGMSRTFHRLYRTRLCRGEWRDKDRPILINNWEATYFNFNHDRLLKIARAAAELGIELFVLDDGWFGRRDSDNCSLGDWTPDLRKLPEGLRALAEEIHGLGMKFGLWFEPEMVSPDSNLYRAHPDWCLHAENRRRSEARNQLILDLSRKDVQDHVISAVSAVLGSTPIDYVKWDMNRNFKEAGSALLKDGLEGEISTRYMLGLYRVLEAVTSAFPHVLFESCSGGGGRFDPGMLYYMPQTWTSDDSDAVQRLRIQYGTGYCYPPSSMGAHVSAVPNHQVGRITNLKMRGDVALSGNFGYELDLSAQTPEDLEQIRQQVKLVKEIRRLTRTGVYSRLCSPFDGNIAAWQFAGEDLLLICCYRVLNTANFARPVIYPVDVPEGTYRDREGNTVTASDLMAAGVLPEFRHQDFASDVMIYRRIS